MLKQGLRLLLLRVLPRRLLPVLTVIEIARLIRNRRRTPQPVSPRRLVTIDNAPGRRSKPPKSHRIAEF